MTQQEDQDLRELLKQAIPPVRDTELDRDLWPQMLQRLDQQRQPQSFRVPWFDWALAALAIAALLFFPGAIPALLYHL
jgi:type VI protein secretion system component VasF